MNFAQLDDSQRTELWACLALQHTAGLGANSRKKLCDFFGSPYRAVQAAGRWREAGLGLREPVVETFTRESWRQGAREAWEKIKDSPADILLHTDPLYPEKLKELCDAPLVLYYLGDVSLLNNSSLAVVGARDCTDEGMAVAAKIARELSQAGITCISGLARGIDRVVHIAGLEGVGSSIAVLGSGIDVPYPSDNIDLYRVMAEKGLLLSEFTPGTNPLPAHFPIRNRIISGLAKGVLVVEAALRSGTLITARHALEQNREVFAVPGSTLAATSEGCRELIRRGARPVFSAEDILLELAPVLLREIEEKPSSGANGALKTKPVSTVILPWTNEDKKDKTKKSGNRVTRPKAAERNNLRPALPDGVSPAGPNPVCSDQADLNDDEKVVLRALAGEGPRLIDEISSRTGLPVSRVSGALLMLELKGLARHLPGMMYLAEHAVET
ncbi:MAG: DNA-processing protein DprA [Deltaproteobacteria bacterium]|nr:DNA-processing protein DprA [Deltaproteobacteria bacterium]